MPSILITRPEPQASKTAERFRSAGWQVMLAPVMELHPSLPPQHEHWQQAQHSNALLFTSQMALSLYPFAAPAYQGRVYITGDVLAGKATAQGFHKVRAAAGNAASLYALVQQAEHRHSLLCYPHGREISHPLSDWLSQAGFMHIHAFEAYHNVGLSVFPDAVHAALSRGDIDAITCYSVQTAKHLIRLCKPDNLWQQVSLYVTALCLSEAIAEVLRQAGWKRVIVSTSETVALQL